jgi:SAM-dependent methyltransferase
MRQKLRRNWKIYKQEYHEKGLFYIVTARVHKFFSDPLSYRYYRVFKSKRTFTFQGKKYHYVYNKYNFTWVNERAVEIPLMWDVVKRNKGKKILEIGNVLAHYYPISHDVLDKYEIAGNVVNEDVVSFKPKTKYDVIISVSTFEHVGWDESPREHNKILPALKNLMTLLKPGGQLIFTVPIGYNDDLQKLIRENKLPLTKRYFLKRLSKDNAWIEADWNEVKHMKYHSPYPNANAIMVGVINK